MSPARWTVSAESPSVGSEERGPELADVGRYGRYLVGGMVRRARTADRPTFRTLVGGHLGRRPDELPVTEVGWPAYEQVNVQAALDAWLGDRDHEVLGMTGYRHRGPFGMADLVAPPDLEGDYGPRPGNVSRVSLPSGPDGQTRACLRMAVVLTEDGGDPMALLLRGSSPDDDLRGVAVEIVATDPATGPRVAERLRALTLEHNVYRGQVVSFGRSMFGDHGSVLRFHTRTLVPREALVLPTSTFEDVRRQVIGVARNRDRLRAAGQHLKRGVLLYGPPGVGKTHTVRHLVGELSGTTVVELTGDTLGAIKEACSIARTLQPAMIVVEDVDLIAQERDHYGGSGSLLFTLLNEMDGLDEDADVVFLLTTNRPDLLEPALAERPGRVDQAVHIDRPDDEARRRLIELYRGGLELDTSRVEEVVSRTDGVTASFLKELLRRAAVVAAEASPDGGRPPEVPGGLAVSADDLDRALDELLDTRNRMTRAVLGFRHDAPG